jgi:hypothetical protein
MYLHRADKDRDCSVLQKPSSSLTPNISQFALYIMSKSHETSHDRYVTLFPYSTLQLARVTGI